MARAARPRSHRGEQGSLGNSRAEVAARVETPQVDSTKLEPVKSEPAKPESATGLRRSTE